MTGSRNMNFTVVGGFKDSSGVIDSLNKTFRESAESKIIDLEFKKTHINYVNLRQSSKK
jgi:hypothetical protein